MIAAKTVPETNQSAEAEAEARERRLRLAAI